MNSDKKVETPGIGERTRTVSFKESPKRRTYVRACMHAVASVVFNSF